MTPNWLKKLETDAENIFEHAAQIKPAVQTVITEVEKVVADFKNNPDTSALESSVADLVTQVKAANS